LITLLLLLVIIIEIICTNISFMGYMLFVHVEHHWEQISGDYDLGNAFSVHIGGTEVCSYTLQTLILPFITDSNLILYNHIQNIQPFFST